MSIIIRLLFFVYIATLVYGCAITAPASKYDLADGYYYSRLKGDRMKKYYIVSGTDSVKVYPSDIEKLAADTVKSITLLFPPNKQAGDFTKYIFRAYGFDLDIISIIFKYRPPAHSFPGQVNTNFNGAAYAGFRKDYFTLSYDKTPLHVSKRKTTHYGFSIGGFAGIGAARIDEFVTLNRIDYEYDGAIITTGIATELGFNKLNFGLECGLDFLTDVNSHVWVSQEKPWIGVSLGLNLN